MWSKIIVLLCIPFLCLQSFAQSAEDIGRILRITGCENPEELDAAEVERLSSYIDRPLRINLVAPSSFRTCGLFTSYQAASLADYLTRHGNILSFSELACVDGFTEDYVDCLRPFLSLDGGTIGPSDPSSGKPSADVSIKSGIKLTDATLTDSYGIKARCRTGGITTSLGYSGTFSGNVEWTPIRKPFRIIAGDFNARFGQGLVLWNGMSMTGFSNLSSFSRSSTGLSSSWSYTGSSSNTGFAAEYSISRFCLSGLMSFPGIKKGQVSVLPALNIGWYGRNMSMSITHVGNMKTSADMAMCVRGTDLFSEFAFDWANVVPAALMGLKVPFGEDLRMGLHFRFYPAEYDGSTSAAPRSVSGCSNEYGTSLCCAYAPRSGWLKGTLSLDGAYLPVSKTDRASVQYKLLCDSEIVFSERLKMLVRITERYRTWGLPFKTELRTDLVWSSYGFSSTARVDILKYRGLSFLAFAEGGYKSDTFSVYLKQLFFFVDNWDDRIYSYERDAPGNFSVPAFYGRGMNTSMMSSWRFSRWGRVYLKGSMTLYPFMSPQKKKPGKAELKIQFVFSL